MKYKRRSDGTLAVAREETDSTLMSAHLTRLPYVRTNGVVGVVEEPMSWPAPPGIHPMAHQVETSDFLVLNPRALVLDDTGTGKTYSVAWSIWRLWKMGLVKKVGIVSPKSTLYTVWERTLSGVFLSDVTIGVKDLNCEVVIGNIDWWKTVKASTCDLYVIDEATVVKNTTTQRWRALYKLTKDKMLWLLTATPMSQGPMDAHGLARMLRTTEEGKGAWKAKTMYQVSRFKWLPRIDVEKVVYPYLTPAIRHTKGDCLDLPPITYTEREVELTGDQKRILAELKSEFRTMVAGGVVTAAHEAALRIKFLQILSGMVYGEEGVHYIENHRMDEITSILDETAEPVLVFTIFKGLTSFIPKEYAYGVITGDTHEKERRTLIDRFQEGDLKVLYCHPLTVGHGVTLTKGATVIWANPPDSAELFYQGNSRLHRKGQEKPVSVLQLISHPLERVIFQRLKSMETLQGVLLDLF